MQERRSLVISEHFRIKKPTLALVEIDGHRSMTYIDAGDTVILVNGRLDATGLVNVKWDSQTALMFDSDLRERAELVRVAGAAL
jgi:hypothetical protein